MESLCVMIRLFEGICVWGRFVRVSRSRFLLRGVLGILCLLCAGLAQSAEGVDVEKYGTVYAVARQSDGKTVLGGNFTLINGNPCRYLARLNSDGTVDETWTAQARADAPVYAIRIADDGIYVGGAFTNISGSVFPRLAKLDIASGTCISAFAPPAPDGAVDRLVLDNSAVYIMGDFTQIGTTSRRYIARLNTSNGAFDSTWNPSPNGPIYGVVPDHDNGLVYLGGNFTYLGSPAVSAQFLRRCASDTGVMDASWLPDMNGTIYAMVDVVPGPGDPRCLFVGGEFTFTTPGHSHKGKLALIRMDNGAYHEASGYAPCINTGIPTAFSEPVYDYPGWPTIPLIYVAGEITASGFPVTRNIIRVWCSSGAAESSFRPNPDGRVHAVAVSNNMVIAGGAFVTTQSDWGVVTNRSLGYAKIDHSLGAGAVKDTEFGGKATKEGVVNAIAITDNGDQFIGGEFEMVDETPRQNLAKLDVEGRLDEAWRCDVSVTGTNIPVVRALAVGGTNLYVGGTFEVIGGSGLLNLAIADVESGVPNENWYPEPNGTVHTLALTGNVLYAGGDFTQISGHNRYRLAKLNAATHAADAQFDVTINDSVRALAISEEPLMTALYIGGHFTTVDDVARQYLAKLDSANGDAIGAWTANADAPVLALALDASYVYAGGVFSNIASTASPRLARISLSGATADPSWAPAPNGPTKTLLIEGSDIYVGGCFSVMADTGITNLARINHTTGQADTNWMPNPYHTLQASAGVMALARHATNLYAGGNFVTVNSASAFARITSLASPVWAAVSDLTTHSFTLNWLPVDGATNYLLTVANDSTLTNHLPGYDTRHVGDTNTCLVTGVQSSRTCYAVLRAQGGLEFSQCSAHKRVALYPEYDVAITDISLSSGDSFSEAPAYAFQEESGGQRETRTPSSSPNKEAAWGAAPDAAINASVTVKNWSDTSVTAGVLCVWDNQGVQVSAPATGDLHQAVGTLGAGESRVLTFTGLDAGDGQTRRAFRAFIDSTDITQETNEANNQLVQFYPDHPVLQNVALTAIGRTDNVVLSWNDPVACGLSNATIMIRYSTN
ncbi:MAG: hypothetical protein EOM20_18835, partial [Spartobacteria bacterium]|nr:hypothetical protein [Spartobacteria bacterium]